MATFSEIKNRVKDTLNPFINPSILEGIYHLNILSLNKLSKAFVFTEFFVVLNFLFFNRDVLSKKGPMSVTIYGIIVSLIALLISRHALKSTTRPYSAYRSLPIIYYGLMLLFGMFISYYHYVRGNQMLIFFAIVFCLVNFIVMPPLAGIITTLSSFLLFYILLYGYDKAAHIKLINYCVLAIITAFGSVHKFRRQAAELERIHRIETMNEMLQNVPVHDNLTDLKNRYALRDDFNSYQNHHIIVLMLDIDEFTKINETHGANIGDAILKEIGNLIKKHLTYSHSYRYGSDSFLIILQDIELGDALQKLSIWERSMATLTVPGLNEKIHYTSGYSHGTPRDEDEMRLLIEAADRKRREYF